MCCFFSVTGSADSGIAENTVLSPEQRVLQEILDTENVYVTDLKQVVEVSPIIAVCSTSVLSTTLTVLAHETCVKSKNLQ